MTTTPFAVTFPRPAPPPSRVEELTRQAVEAVQRMADQMRVALLPALRHVSVSVNRWHGRMTEVHNTPAYVAGLEGRYFVRGALDPAYAHPERRDALARSVLAGEEFPALLFVTPENRARIAAAVLMGWSLHRDTAAPDDALSWHRQLGAAGVVVTRG